MTIELDAPEGVQRQHQQIKDSIERVVARALPEQESPGIDVLLRNYWPFLGALCAAAVAWGVSTAQIASVATAVAKVDGKLDVVTEQVAGMREASKYTERDVVDLRDRVWKLEAKRTN